VIQRASHPALESAPCGRGSVTRSVPRRSWSQNQRCRRQQLRP